MTIGSKTGGGGGGPSCADATPLVLGMMGAISAKETPAGAIIMTCWREMDCGASSSSNFSAGVEAG